MLLTAGQLFSSQFLCLILGSLLVLLFLLVFHFVSPLGVYGAGSGIQYFVYLRKHSSLFLLEIKKMINKNYTHL